MPVTLFPIQIRRYQQLRRLLPALLRKHRHGKPFFQALHDLLDDQQGEIPLGQLVDTAGEQTYGLLVLFLALPSLIPGLNAGAAPVGGLVILLLGIQMTKGIPRPWIPAKVRHQRLHKGRIKNALAKLEQALSKLRLQDSSRRALNPQWTGALIAWTGLLLALPIPLPFGNILPALVLCLLGAALLEERHSWGWLGAAGSLVITIYFGLSFNLIAKACLSGLRTFRSLMN